MPSHAEAIEPREQLWIARVKLIFVGNELKIPIRNPREERMKYQSFTA